MTETTKHITSGLEACQSLALDQLDDYTAKLIHMVESSTHGLSVSDIKGFLDTYKAETKTQGKRALAGKYEACQKLLEQELFDRLNRKPFRRIIAMRLARLFAPVGGLTDGSAYLSRRMLPGLFTTFEKMAGEDAMSYGEGICAKAIDELKAQNKGTFLWHDLYEHADVVNAVDDLLMVCVPHLANVHKRALWMRTLINNELAQPDAYDFEGPAVDTWELDEAGTLHMLRHLFMHLRHQLTDQERMRSLVERHGKANVQALLTLQKALDSAAV